MIKEKVFISMIILKDITKFYRTDFWKSSTKALDQISFEIIPGSITGFLGANGAGKTTSIKIILGITSPSSGSIDFSKMGKNKSDFLKGLGYMPERPYYYQNVSGRQFIEYLAKLNGLSLFDITTRLKEWSERLNLAHAIDRNISTYSKGMLQRLGMISAVIHTPKLLILDEPVSGLDPIGRKDIKEILKELNTKHGMTIFFSTHIIPDVEEICDQLIFLKKGKLIYSGKLSEILISDNQKFSISYTFEGKNIDLEINSPDKEMAIIRLINSGAKINKINTQVVKLEEFLYGHEK